MGKCRKPGELMQRSVQVSQRLGFKELRGYPGKLGGDAGRSGECFEGAGLAAQSSAWRVAEQPGSVACVGK